MTNIAITITVALILLSILFAIACFRIYILKKKLKETSGELSKERRFLNHVLEATNTNINITDTEFDLQYVDPSWQKVYGNPAGRKCYEYFMGRKTQCETCGISEALKNKKTITYEEVMPTENNRVVEVHASPFLDDDGKWMVAEFNVDITRRKRAEEALQTTQRLESLGILAGGIAHDFNNLLAGIFGHIEIALEQSENEEVSDHLQKASNAIERTRGLTGQLLTFAKGGVPIKKIHHIKPFIEETVKFALSGAKVSYSFNFSKDLPLCEFDKNQIGQVLDNLVINAQQAMPEGGNIEIFAEETRISDNDYTKLDPGRYVKITVRDRGIGIPKDALHKIFDPFFTTKTKGAGLGLATSYSIVKRHGGFIEVQSDPEKGSSFTFFLPATSRLPHKNDDSDAIEHFGTGSFLLMDDQKIIRLTTGKMIENLGYSVVLKEDGESAVEYFIKNHDKIRGMIFDLTIPGGMGGLEAVSRIRKINSEVPVFVSSGYADDPAMADPQRYGFTASITKPFTKSELVRMLNKHVKTNGN